MRGMNDLQKKSTKPQSGFTLILSVVLLSVIMVAGIELLNYASSGRQVTKRYQTSVNTFQLAESGLQKAIFCLNAENGAACGGNFGELYTGESGLMFGDGIINIEIIGSGDEREITATGLGPTGESTSIKSSISRAPSINTETQFEYSLMVMNSVSEYSNCVSVFMDGALEIELLIDVDSPVGPNPVAVISRSSPEPIISIFIMPSPNIKPLSPV